MKIPNIVRVGSVGKVKSLMIFKQRESLGPEIMGRPNSRKLACLVFYDESKTLESTHDEKNRTYTVSLGWIVLWNFRAGPIITTVPRHSGLH